MKAKLKPLFGKYYGTEIIIDFQDGYKETLKLWDIAGYEPSIRQLEYYGYTQKQWDNNEEVADGWVDDSTTPIRELDLICDSHFESKVTYERALNLISKINK